MAIRYFGQYTVRKQRKRAAIIRFLEKIVINPDRIFEGTPCWEWHGAMNHLGYGRFNGLNESYAHRFAYRFFVDEIPTDFDIDHLCRNRRCQSPFHIQAVTHKKNCNLAAKLRTHCPQMHPFDDENTHIPARGGRICKKCRYESIKRWRQNHPEKAREVYREFKTSWRNKQRKAGRTGRF